MSCGNVGLCYLLSITKGGSQTFAAENDVGFGKERCYMAGKKAMDTKFERGNDMNNIRQNKTSEKQWAEQIAQACEAFAAGDSSRALEIMSSFGKAPIGIAQATRMAKLAGADTVRRALDIYRDRFDGSDSYAVFNLVEILRADGSIHDTDLSRLDLTGCTLAGADLHNSSVHGAKADSSMFFPVGHSAAVRELRFRPGTTQLLTLSFDKSLRVWDYETGALVYAINGLSSWASSTQYSSDGERILINVGNGSINVLDADSGVLQSTIVCDSDISGIAGASFSPDGRQVLARLFSGDLMVFDSLTGERRLYLKGNGSNLCSAQYSPCGKYVLAAYENLVLMLWNACTGRLLMTITDAQPKIGKLYFSADNKLAASAGEDRSVRILNISAAEFVARLDPTDKGVFEISFSTERAVRKSDDTAISENRRTRPGGHRAQKYAFSADRRLMAIGYSNGAVCIFDTVRDEPYRIIESSCADILDAAWSRDGKHIAISCSDCSIKIIDASTGTVSLVLTECDEAALAVYFSPGGISAVYSDFTVRTWDTETGELVDKVREDHEHGFIAESRDGSIELRKAGCRDAMIFDSFTDKSICRLHGHRHTVIGGAFSIDGKFVVTASRDKTAIVWDSRHGCDIAVLSGHTHNVLCAGFSPDAQRVVTGSMDATAKVWDAASGELMFTLEGHPGKVTRAAYSEDGSRILTVSGSCVRIWDSEDGSLLDTIVNTAGLCVLGCEIGSLHPESTLDTPELRLLQRAGALLG